MRITLEPTNGAHAGMPFDAVQHRVIIEHPYDDLPLAHIITLVRDAIGAYGYEQSQVDEYFSEE